MVRYTLPGTLYLCLLITVSGFAQVGRVGIGVDTPQTSLHVAGTLLSDSIRLPHGAASSFVLTSDSMGNGSWQPVLKLHPDFVTTTDSDLAQDPMYIALNDSVAFIAHHQIGEIRSYDLRSNPPAQLDIYDTGPFPSYLSLVDNILVVLEGFRDSIHTIDVSDPSNMLRRDGLAIPVGAVGSHAEGHIVGVVNFIGNNVQLYHIGNPDSIYLDTAFSIGSNPKGIRIFDNKAYVIGTDELSIIDISDTENVSVLGTTSVGQNPSFLRVNNSFAYILDISTDSFYILDVSDPADPQMIGQTATGGFARTCDVSGNLIFIVNTGIDSILVFDISNPTDPKRITTLEGFQSTGALEVRNSKIYLLDGVDDFLRIISFGPSIPLVDMAGNMVSFDRTFNGRLEISSPSFRDHLRLTNPNTGSVDISINNTGLFVGTEESDLLFSKFSNGYFGVGTSTPTQKVHVCDGSIFLSSLVTGSNGETDNKGYLLGPNFNQPTFGMVYEREVVNFFGDDEEKLHFKKFIDFDTVTLMTVHENGNVGIGTTSPDQKLEVVGNLLVNSGIVSINDGLQGLSLVANAAEGYIKLDVGGSGHSNDDIILGDANSASNKVGIGTSTPGTVVPNTMLEVNGGHIIVANNFGLFSHNAGGTGLGAGIDTRTDDGLDIYAGATKRIAVDPSGQVGIGTASPSELLEVNGNILSTGGYIGLRDGDQTISLKTNSASGYVQLDVGGTGHTTDPIILGHAGDLHNAIGIGTTSPDVDLEISDDGSSYLRVTSTTNSQIGIDLVRTGTSSSDYRIANNGGILEIQESVNINGTAPTAYFGFTKSSFRPNSTTLNLDLGISGKRWRDVYITGAVNSSSDLRLKQEIEDLSYGLKEVQKLRPVQYTWKANPDQADLGLIAQEVEKVIPHVVKAPETEDEYYSINYPELVPVLIKAIQEQQAEIDELRRELVKLKQRD